MQSLAWPAAVLAVVIVLRRPLAAVLSQGVRRLKAGPVEVECDLLQAEVREELVPERAGTRQRGLMSDETLAAIEGLTMLRDLAAQAGGDIGADRARDFLALADAVLYALRSKPLADHQAARGTRPS